MPEADVEAAIREHCAVDPGSDEAALRASPLFRGVVRSVMEAAPPSRDERRRGALLGRLAVALGDMAEQGIGPADLGEDPVAWTRREDLEQLLDVWEAGRHPLQLRPQRPAG